MEANIVVENVVNLNAAPALDARPEWELQERLLQLELQLRIYKQGETIADMGHWQVNLDSFQTWYAENVFRIYGLEPHSVKSHPQTFHAFIHEEDREVVINTFEKSYKEKIPIHIEFRIKRVDGMERHVKVVSNVLKNTVGEPLLNGITQDITDRKTLELRLREINEKIQLQNEAFKHAEQIGLFGTWQLNLDTRQVHYSENCFRLFGLRPSQINPGLDSFIDLVHVDDKAVFKQFIKTVFEDRRPPDAEFRIIRTDGRTRHLRFISNILKNAEGDDVIIGVIKDITANIKLENQLKHTNEHLILQNEAFKQAEKAIAIGSWVWNLNSGLIHFSDNIYALHGLKPTAVSPKFESFEPFIHPMDRPLVQESLKGITEQQVEINFSYRILSQDGKTRLLRARCQRIISADGQAVVIGTIQDVTEDMLRNQQLKERIQLAEMLSENIIDKICITNTSNSVIGWNSRAELAFQQSREEVLGRNIFELLPKLKNAEMIANFNKALKGELVHVPLVTVPYLEGYHELTMLPIPQPDGEITAVLTLLHDITEHQKLKEELEQRLEFIEKLLESSVDRIMVLDRNLHFIYWNKKSEEHYHHNKDTVLGKTLFEIFPLLRQREVYDKVRAALRGDTMHIPADMKDGASSYSDAFFIPVKNSAHQVLAVLWIEHDLTGLLKAEKQIKQQKELLEGVLNAPNVGVTVCKAVRNEPGDIIDFEYMLVSSKGQELYGTSDLVGQRMMEKFPVSADIMENLRQLVLTGEPYNYEIELNSPETLKWIYYSNAKFADGFISVWEDITERKKSELQIRKQQTLLQQAGHMAQLGSWELDVNTNSFQWSDQMFDIYGYPGQSFEPTLDFYISTTHIEERASLTQLLDDAFNGKEYSITHKIYALDGQIKWVHSLAKPMRDWSGNVRRIVGTLQDITRQKEFEEDLIRKSGTVHRNTLILRQIEIARKSGTWQWNILSNEHIWSEGMFMLLGLQPFSVQPCFENLLLCVDPRDRSYVETELVELNEKIERGIQIFEFRMVIEGKTKYIRSTGRFNNNPTDPFVVGTMTDITEDIGLQRELQARTDLVEALVDSSADIIIALDPQMKIIVWNKNAESQFQIPREDALDKSFYEMFPESAGNEQFEAVIVACFDGKAESGFPAHHFPKLVNFENYYLPLEKGNEIYGVLIILHDVTHRIENEQKLMRLNESLESKNKRLKDMNEQLSSFALIASHDLKEPLRKIQLFSNRILEKETIHLSTQGRKEFERMNNAVKRMNDLVSDMYNYSTVDNSEIQFEKIDLNVALAEALGRLNKIIVEKKAVIDNGGLPWMIGNPSHFSELFRNLLSNSLKFQSPGSVPTIRIRAEEVQGALIEHPDAKAGITYLKITIIDNGIGFDQQFVNTIFQMFQRLHHLHEFPGTGMGLSICKKIVGMYNGFIIAQGSPMSGASFSCHFPVQ